MEVVIVPDVVVNNLMVAEIVNLSFYMEVSEEMVIVNGDDRNLVGGDDRNLVGKRWLEVL